MLLIVPVAVVGFKAAGAAAVEAIVLAFLVCAFGIGSLSMMVGLLARNRPGPRQGVAFTVLINLLKFPILVVGLYLGSLLPEPAQYCFLATIALVYSCSVWYLAQRQ